MDPSATLPRSGIRNFETPFLSRRVRELGLKITDARRADEIEILILIPMAGFMGDLVDAYLRRR